VIESWGRNAEDVLLLSLPLHHMHGLGVGPRGALCAGGTVVAINKGAGLVIDLVQSNPVTMFFGVPTM